MNIDYYLFHSLVFVCREDKCHIHGEDHRCCSLHTNRSLKQIDTKSWPTEQGFNQNTSLLLAKHELTKHIQPQLEAALQRLKTISIHVYLLIASAPMTTTSHRAKRKCIGCCIPLTTLTYLPISSVVHFRVALLLGGIVPWCEEHSAECVVTLLLLLTYTVKFCSWSDTAQIAKAMN